MSYLYEQIFYIRSSRYSALAGERKHSDPATMSPGDPCRQEPRSPLSGGGRRGPLSALEGEKTVRSITQPKVCIAKVQTQW